MKADTQPRGPDRLRELVVFPEISMFFSMGMSSQGDETVVVKNVDVSGEISLLRDELKKQPDDVNQLLKLGILLDSNGQTNESQFCYQKAERLCREKAAANPRDGLNLTDLGEALLELGRHDEAEIVYRKATSASTNEWRCWVRRGNFLANRYYFLLFPENLRSQIILGQMPSPAILNYRPLADALTKSEASCREASQCFDQAVALAPEQPEVFFQRASYMSVSNWQNCFFRSYRENEKTDATGWLLAIFSKETISNLKKASELSPQNYDYISLAAYFEWFNSALQTNNGHKPTLDALPEATRRFIHEAMTRLENLSQSPDKKVAAGALENLSVLNLVFENYQAGAANARQALALDPAREQSWDLLLGALAKSSSPEEKVAVCEARLKTKKFRTESSSVGPGISASEKVGQSRRTS